MTDKKSGEALGFGSEEGSSFGGSESTFVKDKRFLGVDREGKDKRSLHPENNRVSILPPFSNYFDRYTEMRNKARESGIHPVYPIGNKYLRLRIKTVKDKYPWSYRVSPDNIIIQSFNKLYGHLKNDNGTFSDKLKAITRDFTGFPDHRTILNVVSSRDPSEVRLLDLPTDRKKLPDKSKGKIMSKIEYLYEENVPKTPRRLPLFDLDENVPIDIYVVIPGDGVPNWGGVSVVKDDSGDLKIVDMQAVLDRAIEGGFKEEVLDQAEEYAKELDEVPDLSDIPSLTEDPDACDILGLSTRNVSASQNRESVPSTVPSGPPPGSSDKEEKEPADSKANSGNEKENVSSAFDSFGSSGEDAAAQFMEQIKDSDNSSPLDDEPPF